MLALREKISPLLRDLPLLLLEQGARVGAGAGEGELELGSERALLALDDGEQVRLRLGKPGVERGDASQRPLQEECGAGGEGGGGEPTGGHGERSVVAQGECDPDPDCSSRLEESGRRKQPLRRTVERGAGERKRGEHDAAGEDEIGDGRQRHGS